MKKKMCVGREIKSIYRVLLETYRNDDYFKDWELVEGINKLYWKDGFGYLTAISYKIYGELLEKYWGYKK